MAQRSLVISRYLRNFSQVRLMSGGEFGSGAGHGGGSGGSVRDAGGSFGKMEAAHEEQYFRKLQAEQLKALHDHLHDEIQYHEKEIREHEEDLKRHKEKLKRLQLMKDKDHGK